ncbi:MAG: serine/threonine protein kinase [Akkermansia sp.]|nr:serine/threonine protein kinase [Akkermansia sp.]
MTPLPPSPPPPVPVVAPPPAPLVPKAPDSAASADARLPLPVGTTVGRYIIASKLGQGGFGITYRATDKDNGAAVVLKEHLPAGLSTRQPGSNFATCISPEAEARFKATMREFTEEVTVLKGLSHPGIVPILDSFEANGTAYFVMPFVPGVPLKLSDEASLEPAKQAREARRIRQLLYPLLSTLEYLEQHNIVHRDIKPDNILIPPSGSPILLDFGSARQLQQNKVFTNIFTPDFCAPEQACAPTDAAMSTAIGAWTDIYSLGATLYYLITRLMPPKAEIRAISSPDPYVPLAHRKDLSALYGTSFLQGIDRALELDPAERWQNATAWRASMDEGIIPASPRLVRRMWILAICSSLALAVLGGLALWALSKKDQALTLYHSSLRFTEGMLYDFNNELADIPGSTHLQRKLGTHLNTFLSSMDSFPAAHDEQMQNALVTAWQNMGTVHVEQGNLVKATNALRNATVLAEALSEAHPEQERYRYELARIYLNRAEVARRRNMAQSAKTLISRALVLLREVCRNAPGNPDYQCTLGEAINSTADMAKIDGDAELQKKALDEMLALHRDLVANYPKHENSLKGLAYALQNMGQYHIDQGDFATAAHLLEEEYNIFSELHTTHPYRLSFKKGLSLALYTIGSLYNRMGSLTEDAEQQKETYHKALQAFRQHIHLAAELEKLDEHNAEYPFLQCRAMAFMVNILLQLDLPNEAEKYSNDTMKKAEKLLATAPDNADYAMLKAGAWRGLAMAHSVSARHTARADKEFAEYRREVEKLLNQNPGSTTLQFLYADALSESAAHALRQGSPAQARTWLKQAEALLSASSHTSSESAAAKRLQKIRLQLSQIPQSL